MLTARVQLFEFLDALPLAGSQAQLRVRVAGQWMVRVQVPPIEGAPHPHGPPEFVEELRPDFARAVTVEGRGTTGPDGRALIELSLDAAVAAVRRQRKGGKPPVSLAFDQSLSADAFGVSLPWSPRVQAVGLGPDATIDRTLVIDVAKSIVGDTSAVHTTLWFQLHGAPAVGDRHVCELRTVGSNQPARRLALRFDAARAQTATTVFLGLQPATRYGYLLIAVRADNSEHVLTQGRLRTLPADPQRLSLAFGSCHLPSGPAALGRWQTLSRRDDHDLLFLIGDQIYGDGIEKQFADTDSWLERYIRRYNQLWAYQPMRDAMRSRPTYMSLDDHEVVDDWGTDRPKSEPAKSEFEARERDGVEAYRIFQQAHNPGGYGATRFDYHYRRGPAAFYFTDSRSARGRSAAYPVMGSAQLNRMRAWSRSAEVREADLVFVVVPVPPAILPIAEIEKWASLAAPVVGAAGGSLAGAIAGGILGGIGGFIVGGPAGAAAGAALGAEIGAGTGAVVGAVGASAYYEHLEDTIQDPDVRDAWTYDKNLPDLVRLMDLLFDIANDIDAQGRPGPRPKGVFILSGDYHFGAIHLVRSTRKSGAHDHRNNPAMVQITSSSISKDAVNMPEFETIIRAVESGGEFPLDGDHYRAKFIGRLMQRNFGRVAYERSGPGRRYRMQMYVEGDSGALAELFEIDLDARPVTMRNLVGELLAARGRITLLRVHDVGGGYGPPTDRIDGEVIITLDSEPGRAFGFPLRRDASLAVRQRLLGLLRDAFNHNRTVAIDYLRTGQHNGTLIRASALTP